MRLYSNYILPRLMHCACSSRHIQQQRKRVAPLAAGEVLEIGIGSGLNLPYYKPHGVSRLWGLDPAPRMAQMARPAAAEAPFDVTLLIAPAEAIPLPDSSIDSIVMTFTLCSVADPRAAVREMRRVLKPEGALYFCEHGLAPDAAVRRWQRRLTPFWKRIGGGCHLGRPIPTLLESGGFALARLRQGYIPGWRPASYLYWGSAKIS